MSLEHLLGSKMKMIYKFYVEKLVFKLLMY